MVSKDTRVVDKMGLHMRPANNFITAMTKYKTDMTMVLNGKEISGKSRMSMMAARGESNKANTVIDAG